MPRDLEQAECPPWLERVARWLRRQCASGLGSTWALGVSGGSDSVGLLLALHRLAPGLGLTLTVAHLDHGARGEASCEDAAFVASLAKSLGLPFDLGQWRATRTGHFESDARSARYEWLKEVAIARNAGVVAVGHTLDDQAETILHRIVRGTGIRGLAGMPRRRMLGWDPPVALARPLLSVSRQEIRNSLLEWGQPYREDASNDDLSRTRARIRQDLLPRLEREYNPRVARALVRLGTMAAGSEGAMERHLRESEHDVIRSINGDHIELRRDRLLKIPMFMRSELLRRTWRMAGWPEAGMSAMRWRRLARLAHRGQILRLAVAGKVELTTTDASGEPPDTFVLNRIVPASQDERPPGLDFLSRIEIPGHAVFEGSTIEAVLDPEAPRDETIDRDRLVPPLWLRAPAPGDRFAPLGMEGKSTPLNDFFRGRRVDRRQRVRTPLLCDQVGIVWVVGHRIADRVKVTEATRTTLGLRQSVIRS